MGRALFRTKLKRPGTVAPREHRSGEQGGRSARSLPAVHGSMLPGSSLSRVSDGEPDAGRPSETVAAAVAPSGAADSA
jgi:hypothetical protein